MRRLAVLFLLPLAAACTGASPMEPAKAAPLLDPIAFFTGATSGEGRMKIMFKSAVPISVDSQGVPDRQGGLVVTQRIVEGAKPPRLRTWHLRPVRPGQFTGTLTDAVGPLTASAWGNAMRIKYVDKNGLRIEQWLVLADDRRSLHNQMTVRKWGVRVAWVDERIVKN